MKYATSCCHLICINECFKNLAKYSSKLTAVGMRKKNAIAALPWQPVEVRFRPGNAKMVVGSVAGSRCWSVAMAVKMATLGRVQVVRHLWTGGLSVINCFLATCSLIDVIILLFEAKQLLTNVLQGARALKMIKIKLWITWFYNLARWKKRWTAIKRHRVRYNASSEWPTRILRMGKCW